MHFLCQVCGGRCCSEMRTPPILSDADKARIPADLMAEVNRAIDEPLDVRPDGAPCCWLDPKTKLCVHYDIRPDICREFEPGGEDCSNWMDSPAPASS